MDYPDFIELLYYKFMILNDGKDIKDIPLYNFGNNKKYNNQYIKSPNTYINGWDNVADTNHQKMCKTFIARTIISIRRTAFNTRENIIRRAYG